MQEPSVFNTVLPLLIVFTVVVVTYLGLHKVVEFGMIHTGVLKPLSKTTWDDVRKLRDSGQVYWALRRFRQLKKKRVVAFRSVRVWSNFGNYEPD